MGGNHYFGYVWCGASARSLKSLEKAQLKVARAIVHSQRGQPGPEVLSECNLPTLAWRRRVHCLRLLYILYKGQGPPSLSELLPATVQARTEIVLQSSHSFRFPFAFSSRHLSSFLCFSILSDSGTLFRPLPYHLRVAVFLPSGLFFTPSTKQINFL